MKVLSFTPNLPTKNIEKQPSNYQREARSFECLNLNYSSNTINQKTYRPIFQGLSPKYVKAKAYLDSVRQENGEFDKFTTDIYELNLNKLDGIQEGIKVFEGLNLKEIAFIAKTFTSIALKRGCHNICSHCYAEAKPPIKETENTINKMSWEDFTSLTDGFEELNNRLGFYISNTIKTFKRPVYKYIVPFHDADCSDLVIRDKNGIEHDFIDIAERIYNSCGIHVVFDTASWTPKNTDVQKRVEKIVEYYSKKENLQKIDQFNLSFNPFHALNTKSILEKRLGHSENSDKFRDIYTSRIANALFTLTPIIKTKQFDIINRSIAGKAFEGSKGFEIDDLDDLFSEVMSKLKKLYQEDFKNEQKYIKDKNQILQNLQIINRRMNQNPADFTEVGRAVETFGKDNHYYKHAEDKRNYYRNIVKESNKARDFVDFDFYGIIDANGDYYLTTFWNTFPTELKLNFSNKGKKTAPIKPLLEEDLVITKNIINSIKT